MADLQTLNKAKKIIGDLLGSGMSYNGIAESTGRSKSVIYNLHKGKSKTVRADLLKSLERIHAQVTGEQSDSDLDITRADYLKDREATLALIKQNQELIELVKKMLDEK